jgi:hypothetical protein
VAAFEFGVPDAHREQVLPPEVGTGGLGRYCGHATVALKLADLLEQISPRADALEKYWCDRQRGASVGEATRRRCSWISAAVASAATSSISLSRSVAGRLAARYSAGVCLNQSRKHRVKYLTSEKPLSEATSRIVCSVVSNSRSACITRPAVTTLLKLIAAVSFTKWDTYDFE